MRNSIFLQIATLAFSLIPLSLILINFCTKFFSKYNNNLSRITVILTNVQGILTKDVFKVKTLIFNNNKAYFDEEHKILHLENLDTKQAQIIQSIQLQKDQAVEIMAITTTLCHYPKIHTLEAILTNFFKSCAIGSEKIRTEYQTITTIPSSPEKKFSTIVALKNHTEEIYSFTKGNGYKLLERCNRILINDKKIDIDQQMRRKLKKKIEKLNTGGQKVIAFGFKALPKKRLDNYTEHFTETDLVLVGLIGFGDVVNIELAKQIEELKAKNVKIYIVGAVQTRRAIYCGQALKIINPNYFEAINGSDLNDINDQRLAKMLSNKEKDYIFAELKPDQHLRIIDILKENGETIALIEKDKNDLKDIIKAIQKSREIKENNQKLLFHSLISKIAEFLLILSTIILKAPLPLSIFTIIVLDLTINIFLEFSLRKENTANGSEQINQRHLIFSGFFLGIILISAYFINLFRFGWIPGESLVLSDKALFSSTTIIFVLLATTQIFQAFNLRQPKKSLIKSSIFSNIYLNLTSVISILIIYIFIHFNLNPLNISEWAIVVFGLLLVILFEELRKYLIRHKTAHEN